MDLLTNLTPAENYLIKEHSNATFKEALKLTIADLLLKKIIRVDERKSDEATADEPSEKYVMVGDEYKAYQARKHETVILSPFANAEELEIHFKDFIKTVFQNASSFKNFCIKLILKETQLLEYFKQNFWFKLFGTLKLNDLGLEFKTKLEEELQKVASAFTEAMKSDKAKALEIIGKIHGNIYLLSGLDPEIIKEIERELSKQSSYSDTDYYPYDTYWLWYAADGYDTNVSFDDVFDSADSSDGGDGGDGGCSGCGGCGGD